MAKTAFKYNPSQQSVEELEQTFVGRQELLEGILTELHGQTKGSSRQHYVIVGPRGIGKTSLLLMIYYAVKKRSELAEKWVPVRLAEESYSVVNLADFLLETLRALSAEVDGLDDQVRDISSDSDDQAVIDRGIDLLRNVAEAQGKGILVLVDNLDMILEDQMRDQMEVHRLRSMLMAQDFITIIGTSPTLFNELTNYDSPLYNFFKTINLKELSSEEMEELIAKRLTMEGKPDKAEALAHYRPRLQAIRHLTGGNPRLLLLLYQVCEHGAIPEVKQALETLLDELTPYFKHRMESLSPQMRKLLDTLARSESALTPTEIAQEARVDVRMVNVQLARMKAEGLVTATPVRRKRSTYYEIAERLFGIWYKMRLSRRDKNEVYFLAAFFQTWYQAGELLELIEGLGEQFSVLLASGDQRAVQHVLESLHIVGMASRDVEVRVTAIANESGMLISLGRLAEAADKLGELEEVWPNGELFDLLRYLVPLRASAGQWGMAVRCAEKGFRMLSDGDKVWARGLWTFHRVEGTLEGKSGTLLFETVGRVMEGTDRDVEAVFAILDDAGTIPETWLCLGIWLCTLGRFAAASVAYRTLAERALANGDAESAQEAEGLRAAALILAERIEPADSPLLGNARRNLPEQGLDADLSDTAFMMFRLWQGVLLAVHGFDGMPHVPEVREVNSHFDAMLRAVADAVALKTASNPEQIAAQIGSVRKEIADAWIADLECGQSACSRMANIVGLLESDRGTSEGERESGTP